jgi:hypothetical protein
LTDPTARAPVDDPALIAAHAAAWAAFHDRQMVRKPFKTLEVCRCPVCVDDAMLRALLDTPVRQMSSTVLSYYTHSAHGVPGDVRELFYFLPRYLELIAADDEPDRINAGCVLSRLGDLRRDRPDDLSPARAQVLDGWMRAYVAHLARVAAAAVTDPEAGLIATLWSELAMLLAGGFPGADIVRAYQAAFDDPATGWLALAGFLRTADNALDGGYRDPLYAARYAALADRLAVRDWLTGHTFRAWVAALAAHDLDDPHRIALRRWPDWPSGLWQHVFHLDDQNRPLRP